MQQLETNKNLAIADRSRISCAHNTPRASCNAGRHSPSSGLLYSLHWLPVRHRIEFKTATLCFKAVKLGIPSYLNNMLKPYAPLRALRSSNMDLLTVPRTDTSLGLRRFSVAGPQVWNRLPHELRQCNTISSFKSNLQVKSSSQNFVLQVKKSQVKRRLKFLKKARILPHVLLNVLSAKFLSFL